MASTTADAACGRLDDAGVGVLLPQRGSDAGQGAVVGEAAGVLLPRAEAEHVGVDRTGQDLDDPDAEGSDLDAEAVPERGHGRLRGTVGRVERDRRR